MRRPGLAGLAHKTIAIRPPEDDAMRQFIYNGMPRQNRFALLLASLAMLVVSATPSVTLAAQSITYVTCLLTATIVS